MKTVSSLLLICLTLVITGCSSEIEEAIDLEVESSETTQDSEDIKDAQSKPEEAETETAQPSSAEKQDEDKVPLPPFDAENMAQNLKEAGAVFAKIENGTLEHVNFFRSKKTVTDETIELLVDEDGRTPETMVYLNLYGANLTDKSLKIIARIPSLKNLNLNNVSGEMTSEGIASMVKSLPNLTALGISHSRITNEGLKPIGSLQNLNQLVLDQTNVGDESLAHLKNLKKLKTLKMSGTKVTDDGLVHLTALPQLEHLTLSGSEITGAGGVEHLNKLTNLEYLSVPRENFQREHYDALKAANPKLWK